MTRTTARMTRRGALGALGALATLGLAACGGAGSVTTDGEAPEDEKTTPGTESEDPSKGTDPDDAAPSTDEDEAASPNAGPSAELPIGAEFKDETLGDTVTIVSAQRNLPSERQDYRIEGGGEVIYVQVAVTPGTQFGGTISPSDFRINPGEPDEDNTTLSLADEITAAGLQAFESASRRDGGNPTGWIGFVADKRKDTYTAAYVRREAKVLGEDTVIPEFRGEFTIPAV